MLITVFTGSVGAFYVVVGCLLQSFQLRCLHNPTIFCRTYTQYAPNVQSARRILETNVAVVPGYADVRASAVMTDDNNDDVDEGNFDDTLSEILGTSSRVATSPNLDLAFGAVDVNVDRACTSLLSPLSHLLSSFFCCCWGAHLRSRSSLYHNHLFPLLVVVL